MMGKYEELFKLNEELARLVIDTFGTREFHTDTQAQTVILFFVAKAYKTHQAILHLCRQGYGEDAGILLRSLFELAVNALYIKDNAELAQKYVDFEAIYVQRFLEDPNLKNRYMQVSENKLAETSEAAQRAREKHGYKGKNRWSGKTIREMAEEVGLGGEAYASFYVLVSQLVHSTIGSATYYVKPYPNRSAKRLMLSPTDNLIQGDLLTAGFLTLDILMQWSKQFDLGIETKISELRNKLIELKEKYVQTRTK